MKSFRFLLSLLIPCLLALLSCQSGTDLTGTYEAVSPLNPDASVTLVLKAEGKGAWSVDGEEVAFQWEVRGDELWLHTRSGGVLTGRVGEDDSIDITLAGVGKLLFKKSDREKNG